MITCIQPNSLLKALLFLAILAPTSEKSSALVIPPGETLELFVETGNNLVEGPIESVSGDILKTGDGSLTLVGDSSIWGGTLSIVAGEVFANEAIALGNSSGGTNIGTGTTLHIGTDSPEPVTINGGILRFLGTTVGFLNERNDFSGPIQLDGDAIFTHRRTRQFTNISGDISGSGGIRFEVSPTANIGLFPRFTLSGNNSYEGETVITGTPLDQVFIDSSTALGSADTGTVIENGTVSFLQTVAEPLDIRGGTIGFLSGATTTGEISISGGELRFDSEPLVVPINYLNDGGSPTIRGGNIQGGINGSGLLLLAGNIEFSNSPIAHDGGLRLLEGILRMNAPNTYSGDTLIESGFAVVNHPQAFGTSNTPVVVMGQISLNTRFDRDLQIGGSLVVEDPGFQINSNLTLGMPGGVSPSLSGPGTYNGDVFFNGTLGSTVSVNVNGGTFNGEISGEARQVSFRGDTTLNSNNTYRAITRINSNGNILANAPAALGDPEEGTLVVDGTLDLNVDVLEATVVQGQGRINVNAQQTRLPRLFSTNEFNPPRTQVLALNHAGTYREKVDVFEGTLEVNANTTIESALIRRGGQLTVSSGATLSVGNNTIEIESGNLEGALNGANLIRKTTGYEARIGNLPGYDGDIFVENGSLIVTSAGSLGTTAGATRLAGGDTILQFNVPNDETYSEDIDLNNSLGKGNLPGMYIRRFSFSHPVIRLEGTLDLGDQGSSIGGPDSGTTSNAVTFELAGPIVGGDLITRGRQFRARIMNLNASHTGVTDIRQGTIELSGFGRLSSTEKIVLHEAPDFFDGRLDLNNRDIRISDRVADSIPIEFRGGSIVSNGELNETLGTVSFVEGNSSIELFPDSTERTTNKTLAITRFERERGAIATIDVSDTARVDVVETPSLIQGIIPWMLAVDHRSSSNRVLGFATQSSRGLVPLTQYQTNINSANQTDNVSISGPTPLVRDATINSLTTINGDLDLGNNTLTIESGGIAFADISNGRLTAGAAGQFELVINRSSRISADIVDNGDNPVSVTTTGSLSGTNSYTGGTYVPEGDLRFDGTQSLPENTDLFISGGNVSFNFSSPSTVKKLNTISVSEGGELGQRSGRQFTLDFERMHLEEGTVGGGTIIGDGEIIKTTNGNVFFTDTGQSTFSGTVLVEQGTLGIRAFTNAEFRVTGGALGLIGDGAQVELAGGDLLVGQSPFSCCDYSLNSNIQVTQPSRIVSETFFAPINSGIGSLAGPGDLTFTGRGLQLPRRDHSITIENANPSYSGNTYIDTISVSIRHEQALGTGDITIGSGGKLDLSPFSGQELNLQNDVYLNGGELNAFTNDMTKRILGDLFVEGHSLIRGVDVLATTHLADQSTLTAYGSGVGFRGDIRVGGNVTLEYGVDVVNPGAVTFRTSSVEVAGTIVSDAQQSVLNFLDRGLSELFLNASLHASAGQSLTLLNGGSLFTVPLSGAGKSVSGTGTIQNDVILSDGAAIAPGNSTGILTMAGNTEVAPGAVYEWEIGDSTSTPGQGWDLLAVDQTLSFSATPSVPWTLLIDDLDELRFVDGEWLIATANEIIGFDPDAIVFDTTGLGDQFQNSMADSFVVEQRGSDLYLVLTVPEPSTAWLAGCVCLLASLALRRNFA